MLAIVDIQCIICIDGIVENIVTLVKPPPDVPTFQIRRQDETSYDFVSRYQFYQFYALWIITIAFP